MNILITGSNGFISRNLISHLYSKKYKIFEINRDTDKKKFYCYLKQAHLIVHLAGVNRPKNNNFDQNVEITDLICQYLIKKKLKKKIIFSSSTQINLKNPYGKSKKECEKKLIFLSKKTNSQIIILRLPNVFGKWSKPNYNSVISTFCHNIINNKKNKITEPSKIINFLYIDDLIEIFFKLFKPQKKKILYPKIDKQFKISLNNLNNMIVDFHKKRKKLFVMNMSNDFIRNLYSTYLSFLNKKNFRYNYKSIKDSRGSFAEILKSSSFGQISILKCKPGEKRGNHFHHSKVEKFFPLFGKGKFVKKNLLTNEKFICNFSDKKPVVIETIPGWVHYLQNTGSKELIMVIWTNEIFNKKKTDTYKYE